MKVNQYFDIVVHSDLYRLENLMIKNNICRRLKGFSVFILSEISTLPRIEKQIIIIII